MDNIVVDIQLWQVFSMLAGVVLPLVVGFVTPVAMDPGHKAMILAALSVGTNLLTELANALQTDTVYNLGTALMLGLTTFLIAVGMHYGFWKPNLVTAKVQAIGVTGGSDPDLDRVPGPDHRG